jgi:hypothetical protein
MLSILMATFLVQATADGPAANFNKLPGPEVFTSESKTGLPTSDSPGKLHQEFLGQSKVQGADRVDQERPCSAQPVEARPVVGPVAVDDALFAWLPWGCGALVIISSVLIWIQWRAQRGA